MCGKRIESDFLSFSADFGTLRCTLRMRDFNFKWSHFFFVALCCLLLWVFLSLKYVAF